MNAPLAGLVVALACAGLLSACSGSEPAAVVPVEIASDTYCSLDGMTLADFPGPKAQIHYAQGGPDMFCDTVELFSTYLQPEQQKRIVAMFVHDMGKNDWNHPAGNWIDAKSAFYVIGSKRRGSMGPTLASFAREADARLFATSEGGKAVRFEQVTPDMVTLDGGVIKDQAD